MEATQRQPFGSVGTAGQVNWFWIGSKMKSARLKVRHRRTQRDLYGCVTPAKDTRSATVKFPSVEVRAAPSCRISTVSHIHEFL